MKKILFITIMFLALQITYGQSKPFINGFGPKESPLKKKFVAISFGHCEMITSLGDLSVPEQIKEINQKVSLSQITFHLLNLSYGDKKLFFETSLDFEFNNFKFKNGYNIFENDLGDIYAQKVENSTKNKFTANYINIPVKVYVKVFDDIYMYGGLMGGICYKSYTKSKGKELLSKDDNINSPIFRYGYTMGVMYRERISIYSQYYPNSILSNLNGDAGQITFGVKFNIY